MVFSDFECPFCGRFAKDTLPTIRTEYVDNGQFQLAFRHLPLTTLHPRALPAAVAAECAAAEGVFWVYHDLLFGTEGALDDLVLL
jgi:protein-disulfide isomerase